MAKFVCSEGILMFDESVSFADGSWEINNVTIDIEANTVDYPTMGNGGWTDNISSTKSFEYTWETSLDSVLGVDLDNTIGVEGLLVFYTTDGPTYSGTVVITSANVNTNVDGVATVSWTGTGTGEITEGS